MKGNISKNGYLCYSIGIKDSYRNFCLNNSNILVNHILHNQIHHHIFCLDINTVLFQNYMFFILSNMHQLKHSFSYFLSKLCQLGMLHTYILSKQVFPLGSKHIFLSLYHNIDFKGISRMIWNQSSNNQANSKQHTFSHH